MSIKSKCYPENKSFFTRRREYLFYSVSGAQITSKNDFRHPLIFLLPIRISLLQTAEQRMVVDGLNSLKYTLKSVVEAPLVTVFRVKLTKSMYS